MNPNTRRLAALNTVAALAVAGAIACADAGAAGTANRDPKPASAPAAPAIGVEVATARTEAGADEVRATGRIEAIQAIEVRPEVEGRIVRIIAREGATVSAGDPLIKIDDAEVRAQVAKATADRDLARQTLDRARALLAENAASRADVERAEAAARAAEAQLQLLALRLDRTVVRAPFAGRVGQRRVSVGDYVSPAAPLVTLQTVDPQRVVISVPERHAAELRPGQAVRFLVAAYPADTFTATVDFVDPVVTHPGRTIAVKAIAQNRSGRLQAGMFADAVLATRPPASAVVIPEEALMPEPRGGHAVWAVVDGRAQRRTVVIARRDKGLVRLASGVAAGEQVVVGGVLQLVDGAPVAARASGARR